MDGKIVPHERPIEGSQSGPDQYQLESGDVPEADSEPIAGAIVVESTMLNAPAKPAGMSLRAMQLVSDLLDKRR